MCEGLIICSTDQSQERIQTKNGCEWVSCKVLIKFEFLNLLLSVIRREKSAARRIASMKALFRVRQAVSQSLVHGLFVHVGNLEESLNPVKF